MTPNSPTTSSPAPSGWMNIDQMLQSLSTQPVVVSAETVPSQPQNIDMQSTIPWSSLNATFSIEALAKPSQPDVVPPTVETKESFHLSRWAKTAASLVSTVLLLVVWWFVFSKMYPIEAENMINSVFGVVDTVATTAEKNLEPDAVVVVENTVENIEEMHGSAPDNYITETPLADALEQAQNNLAQDTSTEVVLEDVVWDLPATGVLSTGIDSLPISTPTELSLPSVDAPLTNIQLKEKLLTLSQSAEEAMTNLIGNSDVKMAKMRAIYKKSQALLVQVSDSTFVADDVFRDQVVQLQTLYDGTIVQ